MYAFSAEWPIGKMAGTLTQNAKNARLAIGVGVVIMGKIPNRKVRTRSIFSISPWLARSFASGGFIRC